MGPRKLVLRAIETLQGNDFNIIHHCPCSCICPNYTFAQDKSNEIQVSSQNVNTNTQPLTSQTLPQTPPLTPPQLSQTLPQAPPSLTHSPPPLHSLTLKSPPLPKLNLLQITPQVNQTQHNSLPKPIFTSPTTPVTITDNASVPPASPQVCSLLLKKSQNPEFINNPLRPQYFSPLPIRQEVLPKLLFMDRQKPTNAKRKQTIIGDLETKRQKIEIDSSNIKTY